MELSELKYPAMRRELIEALKSLSDRDYQQRVWIDKEFPHENFYDDLTTTVNIFHDLISDDEDFGRYIGTFLASQEEAAAVEGVHQSLDATIDALGESPDGRYLSDPRWNDVVAKAAHAKSILNQTG